MSDVSSNLVRPGSLTSVYSHDRIVKKNAPMIRLAAWAWRKGDFFSSACWCRNRRWATVIASSLSGSGSVLW
jgi:hypothetical protein